ncbi:MAG: hypothetical protein NT075_02685 [Chloroflexi bacterium]|nr:hypothetical protein [Chloroflexota bacterium]
MLYRFLTQPKRIPSKVFNYLDNTIARFTLQRSAQARYIPAIEQSFREVEAKSQAKFGGWSLSKSAIYTLCRHLLTKTTTPVLIELGSGQSTLFWDAFAKNANLPLRVITFEHNPRWAEHVKNLLTPQTQIEMVLLPLWQIQAQDKEQLFADRAHALEIWQAKQHTVPLAEYDNTRIPNAFYAVTPDCVPPAHSVDAIIVDGPNGSGRSLAYPLLFSALKAQSLVLIDDFDHYPFVPDLARLYPFKPLMERTHTPKHWVLLELQPTPRKEF